MEVEGPKTKTQQCIRILQTTSSFSVPEATKNTPRGIVAATQGPVSFPDLCSNQTLGTTFQLSKIHDTKALLTY